MDILGGKKVRVQEDLLNSDSFCSMVNVPFRWLGLLGQRLFFWYRPILLSRFQEGIIDVAGSTTVPVDLEWLCGCSCKPHLLYGERGEIHLAFVSFRFSVIIWMSLKQPTWRRPWTFPHYPSMLIGFLSHIPLCPQRNNTTAFFILWSVLYAHPYLIN